ncbi:MAG: branched-chain amino acid ABC transporter permease [Hydrogenibacillus schlegelii]|uniref:Branched-chain amino acid ABC transporter permease n=1 Tax=Hydrogenibacillus schlegelii TaxID=1484 RepID=A0A947GB81_HYDSH|nr:branched-chain amino acid ABC transporter permease [Hydrogenibacillus schlegelii]
MSRAIWFKGIGYGAVLALALLLPSLVDAYHLNLLTEVLIFGIFAMSLNLLTGYTGLVSLGHAAFFGVGAYAASLALIHLSTNLFLSLLFGVLFSLMLAAVVGFFSTRVHGFYFLMLTLAFSQMVYALAYRWSGLTGGDNGLAGVPKPSLPGGPVIGQPHQLFYLTLSVFVLVVIALSIFLSSPFGRALVGIRENEVRMQAVGYPTVLYKNIAFIVSGSLAGLAGSLYAYLNGFVSPKELYWTMSGEVLFMVLIGGAGTLFGPVLGAAFILLLKTWVSSYTDLWMMVVGAAFILFVIFVPGGLAGLFRSMVDRAARWTATRTTHEWKEGLENGRSL